MNINDYISSGILELYATGALSEAERLEVEALAEAHPAIREELTSLEKAMESYAIKHAVAPPAHSFDKLIQAIEPTTIQKAGKVVPMKPAGGGNILRLLAYAASILLFVSVAVNVYYFNKYKAVEGELTAIRDDNTFLANEFGIMKADYQNLQSEMNVISNPDYIAITMKGATVSPTSTSIVFWDKTNGDLYISATNLPAPPAGKQYQLWALKDGKPIDAGVFDMKGNLQLMKNIGEADAFAVTLEPKGGSASPTLAALYVLGTV